MARSWVPAFVALVGCGDNLKLDHTLAPADVSILYPLPDALDLLIQPAEQAAFGQLFPEPLLPTAIGPVDIGASYGDMRLIALRFDPCSARNTCTSEVRAIFQPVVVSADGQLTVADGAIHVFYGMPKEELVAFVQDILAAKTSYGDGISYPSALGPHPILVATGLDGEFASELHALVLEHLGESRIERFTEQNHQIPMSDRWDFYRFDRVDGNLIRQDIATANTDEQQVTGTAPDPQQAGGVSVVTPPLVSAELALVDENRPSTVTANIRTGFVRAVELQDPRVENSESIDCVSCHLAEGARRVGVVEYGLSTTSAFQSDRSLEYRRDLRVVTNLHMFAYDGRNVSVTQRVANESAVTADAFEQLLRAQAP
jgi:hypothetical protein